jgi:hypothetical protein
MAAPGSLFRSNIGCEAWLASQLHAGGVTSFAMAPLNSQVQFRWVATDTRDVYYVWVNWSTVSAPGQITVRIETVDTTTGKATGTLYDANAVITGVTPVAGWQQITFATPPSTGLTAGNAYAVVILTTTGGTTMTLRGCVPTIYGGPSAALFVSADTTRANAAESAGSMSIISLGLSDHTTTTEETPNTTGGAVITSFLTIFGSSSPCAYGAKFTVPANETWVIAAAWILIGRLGTPAGDLRCRLLDTTTPDGVISTTTAPVNDLLSVSGRRACQTFPSPVTLTAGTYRLVWDSPSSANSSNCYFAKYFTYRVAALNSSGFFLTTGAPGSWTDDNTSLPFCGLWLQTVSPPGGTIVSAPRRVTVQQPRVRPGRIVPLISTTTITTTVPLPLPPRRIVIRQPYPQRVRSFVRNAGHPLVVRTPARQLDRRVTVTRHRASAILPGVPVLTPIRTPARQVDRRVTVTRHRTAAILPAPPVVIPLNRPVRQSMRTVYCRYSRLLPPQFRLLPIRQPARQTTRTVIVRRNPGNALFGSGGGTIINQTILVTSKRVVR